MADDVEFSVHDGVAHLVLRRPRALNALSPEMIRAITQRLAQWREDASVEALDISGEGRGYCAGADVRWMRSAILDEGVDAALAFLGAEYEMDRLVAQFGKPVTAHLHGISMGGGLGLGMHGSHRIAAPDLAMAMPETQIGLWPDVGMLFEYSRLPGQAGAWLTMTGATIDAPTALAVGLIDRVEGLESAPEVDLTWVDGCFEGDCPAQILTRLETSDEPRAGQAARLIRSRSPLSVAVTLAALRRASRLPDVGAVLDQDLAIARRMLPDCDFVEGVRAQLVDKDHDPHWALAALEDVDPGRVEAILG